MVDANAMTSGMECVDDRLSLIEACEMCAQRLDASGSRLAELGRDAARAAFFLSRSKPVPFAHTALTRTRQKNRRPVPVGRGSFVLGGRGEGHANSDLTLAFVKRLTPGSVFWFSFSRAHDGRPTLPRHDKRDVARVMG